ncbi:MULTISPECIES: polysaccharide biosynthesis tyrosine autokinase [Klebsiella]|jgi:capsular exopolysaccharide family|uniref:polysaccharide biosynthesis tyrosine autokinase n=1 Tax=Klebsiella TaxID=570 RepID=UPI00063C2FC5|nr:MULTISPECIES: polysaccharide biosynthesis tyrosine autokinase [Klebsiella]EIW9476736.1 polysaccharide biosynthesis tyrosine autokinase [Klebsiella aerogenes]EIW9496939.1 polysaccharide biosynthesis tyrosine autokinase [Klebsiella aerogenes]EKM7511907.1 polysaccharide biosynthesis tyrosine autokinase [Klebsiella aerogenes]EKW8938303.1 polysaccharide biosynthesis tyrosine autokinase [Klebsiella aerogenes]EKZ6150900.1 polysaccharide biosynthesis tyrosine autokinase [Klebsiella aerogenes]
MASLNNNTSQDSNDIDFGRLIGELIDHKKLIIAVTAGFTVLAVLYSLLATPIYQANALIQVEQKQGNALLDSLSQMLPDSQPQSAPEIALLQSRMILGKSVDDLNLQAQTEQIYFPVFGKGLSRILGEKRGKINVSRLYLPKSLKGDTPEIILTVKDKNNYQIESGDLVINGVVGKLIEDKGISLLVQSIDAEPGTQFKIRYLPRLLAISNLQDSFSVVDQGKDTGMLNLTLTGDDPELIAHMLDNISQNYLSQNVDRQAAQDAKSLEFLSNQLPTVRSDLDAAEDKLNAYRKQKDSVDLSMEAKSVLDQIVNVDNQLNTLTFKEAEISQLYTKEHPTYKALMEKRKTLQQEKGKLSKRVSAMPSTQQEVLRLSRDVESGRAVYMQLLNRQQELSIAKSSAIGNVRIIDQAITEPSPVKPKKILVIVIGIILGLFISVGLVLVRVVLRRGIESPEQLEELGVNVYASVPVSEWLTKQNTGKIKRNKNQSSTLLAVENPADLAVEAIRSLRTSLHFAMMEAKNNVLMISGASPNAGKTFISTNLAAIIALTGKKVLFVDADLRKGYVHKMLGKQHAKGLSEILSGQESIEKVIERVPGGEFDYIGRGQIPPNPAELLMHTRFSDMIEWASSNYDLVIVDTPPILAVTDAAIIGRYAGTTLLVARFEANTTKEISVSVKRFEQSGVNVKGCILNGVLKKASSYYGYGYNHYGYSYSNKE